MQEQFQQLWSAVCNGEAPAEALCDWLEEYVTRPDCLQADHMMLWAEPDPYTIMIEVIRTERSNWNIRLRSLLWCVDWQLLLPKISDLAPLVSRELKSINDRYV